MKWRIYYNSCFYSDVVAESEQTALEEVEKVLDLDDLFQVDQVQVIGGDSHREELTF